MTTTSVSCALRPVRSGEDFARIFADARRDALLLCYEAPGDGISSDDINALHTSLCEHVRHDSVPLYVWDCTSEAFDRAKAQLTKRKGQALLIIVHEGQVADMVHCPAGTLQSWARANLPRVCELLALRQHAPKPAQVVQTQQPSSANSTNNTNSTSSNNTLRVDVARMVALGTQLMQRGQANYAEKVFCKALHVLDALHDELEVQPSAPCDAETRASYEASVALCLAWAAMAQLVQGKQVEHNTYLERLTREAALQTYCEQPLSEACRACVLAKLMRAAPRSWAADNTNNNTKTSDDEEQPQPPPSCSLSKLRARLQAVPQDMDSRCMLVITLFLSGDMESALTEAVKLTRCNTNNTLSAPAAFGALALRELRRFLGEEHELVRQLRLIVPA